MANESLEGFIQQKIQALKIQKNEVEIRIEKLASAAIAEKKAVEKEISKLQELLNDFKKGVDPLATKVNVAKGGRGKKTQ